MATIKGGELLLKCLAQENVRVIFAVPDGAYNSLLGKLKDYGVRLVPPRHEAAATIRWPRASVVSAPTWRTRRRYAPLWRQPRSRGCRR